MANADDLDRLHAGNKDLRGSDFREADLSGLDLSFRDFSECLFSGAICQNTNFTGCNFRKSSLDNLKAAHAIFDNCIFERPHFGFSDFSNASMQKIAAQETNFLYTNFTNTNIKGSDFSNSSMDPHTKIDGVVHDEMTSFENMALKRALSRDTAFSAYEFRDGRLYRKESIPVGVIISSNSDHLEARSARQKLLETIPASDRIVRMDHNDPGFQGIRQNLEQAIEIVRSTNEHVIDRESAIQSLKFADHLWNRIEISIITLKVGIHLAFEDALEKIGNASIKVFVEAVKTSIVEYIRRNLGI